MQIEGKQQIGNEQSAKSGMSFFAKNPKDNTNLEVEFYEASKAEVDAAVNLAQKAFEIYKRKSAREKADFLDKIAEEILALGDTLIERCMLETALPEGRLVGERGRTVNQLKAFSKVLREGTWLDARIDTAIPDRQPIPKPDIRQMHIPLGPVGIFGASNFPLAFSVAGGDTASALAAGCPVVVKGHPAHPGTSELVGKAIISAAKATGMPEGVFSLVQGTTTDVGMAIVNHPLIKAVGFTGSFGGGKALFDAAVRRPEPIPVYAEMGSSNPVFLLPGAVKERGEAIAAGLAGSVTLGVGQFCTNPGVVIGLANEETDVLIAKAGEKMAEIDAGNMLTEGIRKAFDAGISRLKGEASISTVGEGIKGDTYNSAQGQILKSDVKSLLANPDLAEEVFGPSSLVFSAESKAEMLEAARNLKGHLTATIHGTEADLEEFKELISILQEKAGRVLFNGFPTGVEVCDSMVHGGPFPSTTDSKTTSVGTAAIKRFARPVCFQGFPNAFLPDELKNENPLKIWRLVNGELSKEEI
ncbi:aldehyde dehydrogenase (NADP(+)) [Flexithrix dorotheae]|uniref:aldehyde dehydrogenase (NADP(+)) n=1 Tax=Flexithrix dorotheae TaxID=70993 RepID=UPI00037C693B|nr:aldehyde dehydrogenase (NADP(+)) [Flexithrix dorotheae]